MLGLYHLTTVYLVDKLGAAGAGLRDVQQAHPICPPAGPTQDSLPFVLTWASSPTGNPHTGVFSEEVGCHAGNTERLCVRPSCFNRACFHGAIPGQGGVSVTLCSWAIM